MGYLFLMIALLAGATKGYCGKKTSGYTDNFGDAVLANEIRMVLCIIIGFLIVLASGDLSTLIPSVKMLGISALSGIFTAIFVVTWLISVKKSAYMMVDIFLMLGVLIPLLASNIFFGETIKMTQWLGIVLLFVAVILMCSYNNAIKAKLTPSSLILLLLCGVSSGIADFSQKLFTKCISDSSAAAFNFYTYLFAGLILMVFFAVTYKKDEPVDKPKIKKIFGFILIMAICLFANSFFKTLASGYLSAVLLYPLNQGCALILSAVMASAFFKEKLTGKAILGILIAFSGLLVINLL
ncbi:MAG: DMT family transporter [Clostridia bacterium]|nr:DMT family transporter [Clostridia bacterium]